MTSSTATHLQACTGPLCTAAVPCPSCYHAMSSKCVLGGLLWQPTPTVGFQQTGGSLLTTSACSRTLSSARKAASLMRHGLSRHRCGGHGSHLPPARRSLVAGQVCPGCCLCRRPVSVWQRHACRCGCGRKTCTTQAGLRVIRRQASTHTVSGRKACFREALSSTLQSHDANQVDKGPGAPSAFSACG